MEQLQMLPVRMKIASILRKSILEGEFRQGQELSLTDLSADLGVSRTPVREALQMLEAEGLIRLRMNKGAVVCGIDAKFITDHYELRSLLEGEAAYRAAVRRMDVRALEAVHKQVVDALAAGVPADYVETNQRIHTGIWAAADNTKLYNALLGLWNGPSVGRVVTDAEHQRRSTLEHSEILACIREGEADRARIAMRGHIERSKHNILRSFRAG